MNRVVCFVCACLAIGPALAAGGSVSGVIVDRDGPVVGAVVALVVSEAGPAPKAALSGGDGRYSFIGVPAGTYSVSASFAGGDPVASKAFAVRDGSAIEVPPLSVEIETVEVSAKADDVPETGNTTTGETFQAAKLQYIPTARSYTEVLKIAPGVSEDSGGSNGSGAPAGISVYGSSAQESSYVIDGINTTAIDTGRPSTNINYDLIDKIEIKTGGYNAEYGGAQGAVVNVVTKSGTNEWEGAFNLFLSPDGLASQPQQNGVGSQLPTPTSREIAGSVGGPIVKDKLFFFAALGQRYYTGVSPQQYSDILNASGAPGTGRKVAEDNETTGLYSTKLSWQVTPNHRLIATYFSDPRVGNFRDELGGVGGDNHQENGGKNASLQLESIFKGLWFFNAAVGAHTENSSVAPTLERQAVSSIGPTRRQSVQSINVRIADTATVGEPSSADSRDVSLKVGPYAYSGDDDGNRKFVRTSLEGAYRHHRPKFGAEWEPSTFHQDLNYGWGTGLTLEWSQATPASAAQQEQLVGVRRCWGDGVGNCLDWQHQIHAEAATDSLRVYAQDQWQPTNDLAINYGLRWESQSVNTTSGQNLIKMNKNLAPRFGFTWDPLGEGRSKLYASAGRYYDTAPLQVMSRAFAPRITQTRMYRTRGWDYTRFIADFPSIGTQTSPGLCASNDPQNDVNQPTCWDFESYDLITNPLATSVRTFHDKVYTSSGLLSSGSPIDMFRPEVVVTSGSLYPAPIDPGLKGASTDEVMLGYDWHFKPHWTVGGRIIGRRLNEAIEDVSLDLGKTFIIANPGGPYTFYVDPANPDLWNPSYDPASTAYTARPGLGQLYGCTLGAECTVTDDMMRAKGYGAVPRASRTFRGIELDLGRELTDKFWFNFSYLHSKTEGNYRGRYFVETEERDPNQTEAFDVPALAVNTFGRLPQDRPDQFKAYGSYRVTSDVTLSATARYSSGTPEDATTDPLGGSTPFLGPIYLMPRGSAGRTPAITNLDMGVAYDIRDSKKVKMTVMLDVFNALNEQKATRVDSQFMAVGMWRGAYYDPNLGFVFDTQGRGEPYDHYIDIKFGNGDGLVTPDEWNRWAGSFEGRFQTVQDLYSFLRTETVTENLDGVVRQVPAYPGFANCPVDIPNDLSQCAAINARFGQSTQLEAPRTIRIGFRLTF
jgi:hypothetical protein